MLPQPDLACKARKRRLTDERGADFSQFTLRHLAVAENIVGHNQRKDRIPQKFLPFVVRAGILGLIGVGGVGQRDIKVFFVLKTVADDFFQIFHYTFSRAAAFCRATPASIAPETSRSTQDFA